MFDEDQSKALTTTSGRELAIAAGAAAAKAEVEAGYIVAMKVGRDLDVARQEILKLCDDTEFADVAIKPRPLPGGGTWNDLTIRGIESITQALRHIRTVTRAIYEDEVSAVYSTTTTDLLTNQTYSKEFRVEKTVWRSGPLQDGHLRDMRVPVEERVNSEGKKSYRVMATEEEMFAKINSQESRIIRNNGRRVCPAGILAEAKARILETKQKRVRQDPEAYRKNLADSFMSLGISVAMLKGYFGKPLNELSPEELSDARGIYRAIRDKEARWTDYVAAAKQETETGTLSMDNLKPGVPDEEEQKPERKKPGPKPGSHRKPKEPDKLPEKPEYIPPPEDANATEQQPTKGTLFPESSKQPASGGMRAEDIRKAKLDEFDEMLREVLEFKFEITDKGRIEAAKACVRASVQATKYEEMTLEDIEEAVLYVTTGKRFEDDLRQNSILTLTRS